MPTLVLILMLTVICAISALILIFLSVGIGYLIARIVPSLTITDTFTAGAVITVFLFYCFVKLFAYVKDGLEKMDSDDDDDDDDDSSFASDAGDRKTIIITPSSFIPKARRASARKKRPSIDDS